MDLGPAFDGLNDQERIYVESRLRGLSQVASGAAAGIKNSNWTTFEQNVRIQAALQKGRAISIADTGMTREKITEMLMDAYRCAANATEMVMAARELGKLHGVYAPQKVAVDVEHRLKNVKSERDMKLLPTKELLALVESRGDDVLEAEFEEVMPRMALSGPDEGT